MLFAYKHSVSCEQRESAELPPGLLVLEDYVSLEEEACLLQAVDWEADANVKCMFKSERSSKLF